MSQSPRNPRNPSRGGAYTVGGDGVLRRDSRDTAAPEMAPVQPEPASRKSAAIPTRRKPKSRK